MPDQPIAPISYDPTCVFLDDTGLAQKDLTVIEARLNDVRDEVLSDLELLRSGKPIPSEKQPLDAFFIDLPDRLLDAYRRDKANSELGRLLETARRIGETVDRVIVIGIGGSYMGGRSLFEACCHPYHNELSRDARGGRPRMYFAGRNADNDATQGLLDLLRGLKGGSAAERWAIVVVSKSGGTLEPAVAFRQFLSVLRESTASEPNLLPELVVPITGPGSKLYKLAQAIGCKTFFDIPDGIGGRFSILTAVGLLPAAMLGLDVVKLLEGAAAMNARFKSEPPGRNPALDYAAVGHLMDASRGATIRPLSFWTDALEAVGFWYDQLLSESLGKNERGATPITVINTRDLHSRGQQHQEGRRDKLITNVVIDQFRRDPLAVGRSELDQDDLNALASKTLPQMLSAAIEGTKQAYREGKRPTADIHLPRIDEASLGQLYQMLMLATAVEGYLVGTNPYGQPGVEVYKKHMNTLLRGK